MTHPIAPLANEPSQPDRGERSGFGQALAVALAAVAVMVLGMVAFYFYPYPSGERPSLFSFVALWLRELLIIGCVLVVLVGLGLSRLYRTIQRELKGSERAS